MLNYWCAEAKSNSSWIWKFLLNLRPMAKALIRCNLGDGLSASFWYENWTPLGPLIDLFGESRPSFLGVPINATVAEACDSRGWILPSSRSRNQNAITLRNHLLSIPSPSQANGPDNYEWEVDNHSSSNFSTKLTWNYFRPREETKLWVPAVWFKNSVPKHAFTFWIANLDRLPVRSRLHEWGMQLSSVCGLCNSNVETRDHLLLHCNFVEEIWHHVMRRLGQPPCIFADWSILISWLLSKTPTISSTLKRITAQSTIYMIWKERNIRYHDNVSATSAVVFNQIDRSIKDILLTRRFRLGCSRLLSQWFSHA
ncbi:unnamed protein product [Arabidopsis halleri]